MTETIITLLIVAAAGFAFVRETGMRKAESARDKLHWLERERAKIDGLKVARSAVGTFPDAASLIDAEISKYEMVLQVQLQRMAELG